MSHEGDIASQHNDSQVPSDINAPYFSYFDELPEFLGDYPDLLGLSNEASAMLVQSALDTIELSNEASAMLVQSTLDTIELSNEASAMLVQSTLDTIEVPSEFLEDYPDLLGLSNEASAMLVQRTLDAIEVQSNIEAQSDTTALLQEPAPSTQVAKKDPHGTAIAVTHAATQAQSVGR
ncbi:hypothetical protein BGX38DRAFT_1333869 [Terfezia claveryi]|nr:hypothetical protein BGX38DRAFT_1333869 [Terfezia claveryi]